MARGMIARTQQARGLDLSMPLHPPPDLSADNGRPTLGVERLFGTPAFARIRSGRVAIVGLGGVGSWTAEALARSGVGMLQLIDLDHIAASNINRQVHALENTLGAAKVQVMAERIRQINPSCELVLSEDFVEAESPLDLLVPRLDWVIDCADNYRVKAALIAACRRHKQRLITVGAAGGMSDPTQIRTIDLAHAEQDSLLARVRKLLRQDYGYSRNLKRRFEVPCVYSLEPVRYAEPDAEACAPAVNSGPGLACTGILGSLVAVTGAMGFAAAAYVLRQLALGRGYREATKAELAEP